jgi:VIT1/CCC1 family predicted Fe2+/Mn2+ transporter
LVSGFALDILDKPTPGITVVGVVAGMFTVALTALIIGAFVPNDTVRLVVNGGLAIALLLAVRYLLRKYRR